MDLIDRQAAIDVINVGAELLRRVLDDTDVVGAERAKYEWGLGLIESYISDMKELPSVQSETYKEKLKEIADALSEKFAYMNTCLNERDIILGYLGVKRPSKIHCNTDCTNIKCESHRCNKRLSTAQPERKKGKWNKDFTELLGYKCSVCGKGSCKFNFYPNCGADMREGQDG